MKAFAYLLGHLLLACACAASAQSPDRVLLNGKLVTADERGTLHEALAVREGRIVALGSTVEIKGLAGNQTQIIELAGRTVIPGLIDSHMHAIRAALSYSTEVHWFGAASVEEALGRVREAARAAKPGAWLIVAGGWTEEQFKERRRPTQAELVAAAPEHPVYVQWMYGWAMLTPLAYKALGVEAEADLPGGGKFERDGRGQPTGAVLGGIVPLFDKLPTASFEQKLEGTRKFFRELNRLGITGIVDPGGFNMSPAQYAPLFRVWRDKALTVRVAYSYFAQQRGRELEEFKELTQLLPMGFGDGMLRFNGIGERVTFGMYNNDKPTDADKEQLYQAAKWAAQNGLTLTQHWNNDASVGHLLEVFERVDREVPIARLRWSVAHLNDGSEASFARMRALGVGWTMQDAMYLEGDRALKEKGAAALKRMPPLRTALKTGVAIGAGTDAHRVASYNPFVALRWMLDGKSASGAPLRAAEETPDRLQALRMYTSGSAWFAHDDANRGTLAVGKLADLAVLSQDYLTAPVQDIGAIHSLLTMVGGRTVYAEGVFAGPSAASELKPPNDLPNPYQSVAPWGALPEGRTWGALNAVAIDNDGESVWVANRCGANPDVPPGQSPFAYDSCAGSSVAPVLKLDASGKVLKSFGAGMFIFPHKIYVDPQGNVWVVDQRGLNERERLKNPQDKDKGHTVVKFSPEGKLLLTLGTPGVAGNPPEALTEPTSIVMAPNGDLFVTEGHSGQAPNAPPQTVARISRFTKDGKFIRSFGRLGSGPAEFRTPHDIAIDPQGRLFVADRGNMRIQILDQDGGFIAQWKQFGRPSGLYIRNDLLYVSDSESNGVAPHPGWKRGIRIGSLKDGNVLYRIPDPLELNGTSAAEGVAVDAKGNVYGGEVGPRQLAKHFINYNFGR